MTLEDFFTLTELRDGLTAPARVKELVNIMEKEKHNILKNVSEATRQWSTVASTIAATENKDCLDLFLQLDGLCYFDSWLKDAQKFGNETGDSCVEELITALLGAVSKLHVDNQKSDTSGILLTVRNLLGHNSSRIQDQARALFDSWKQNSDSNVVPQDAAKLEVVFVDQTNAIVNPDAERGHSECSPHSISPSGVGDNDGKHVEQTRDEMMGTTCAEGLQHDEVEEANNRTSNKNHMSVNDGSPDPQSVTDMQQEVTENKSILENLPTDQPEVVNGSGNCDSSVPKQESLEDHLDVANSNEHVNAKQMHQVRSCDKLDALDTSFSADSTKVMESKLDPKMEEKFDAKEEDPCLKVIPSDDARAHVFEGCGMVDINRCRDTLESENTGQSDKCNAASKMDIHEEPGTYLSRIEDAGAVVASDEKGIDDAEDDSGNDSDTSRSAVNNRDSGIFNRMSDVGLEYGTVDPLEVARQVAIEVEREVDCREPSCTSSERTSGGRRIRMSESPDSINRKEGRLTDGPTKDVPSEPNLSVVSGDGALVNAGNVIAEQENHIPDMDSSQVIEAEQKEEPNTDKLICGFDLNEDVASDDMDHQINSIAPPISVVSASRAAAATGFPNAPLQFEGALGWKGSAETSAFRPAPPRRISDGEKSLFVSGSHDGSRQQQDYLDFDLNVAECDDEINADLLLGKEIPNSSGRPSGDSSVEVSPKRTERIPLDLNRVSDGGDAPSYWKRDGHLLQHWNGNHSPSPSSSSSSMQPSLRNIDLNDQPSLINEVSDPSCFGKSSQNFNTPGGSERDDPVISIMGAKVEVKRKEFVPQTSSLSNGRILDHAVDANSSRIANVLGMGPTFSPVYGYNVPPPGPTLPFSSAMYGIGGHISYMVDSSGSPVVPQILGSTTALPAAFSQAPYVMNMTGALSTSNGVGALRHNFDLNSGLMLDGGNRDTGSLRQLFNSAPGRSMDENSRANYQSASSSGIGGKRKETDGGWEPLPFNLKHHQPPWK